jgi:hypothetical protein
MAFEHYDPTWLVILAEQQFPEERWLQEALKNCTSAERSEDGFGEIVTFIDRMEGKFKENVVLIAPQVGRVALDILVDGRVGGYSIIEMPFSGAY